MTPGIPGATARLREDRYSVGCSRPAKSVSQSFRPTLAPAGQRWASFPFANDKRLEVLSGTNVVDLLKSP
jgi:hypothetical protein